MRFFKPNYNFWNWFSKEKDSHPLIVEIGCGDGDLLREMSCHAPCLGVDPAPILFDRPIPMDLLNCYLPMDILSTDLINEENALFLVARPCHSGFPGDFQKLRNPKSSFFYIGFPCNLADDLGSCQKTLIASDVGEDHENIYKIC